jgi:hypothetical protein
MSDKIRLLICQTCGSIEELPFFDGPPEHDDWLKERITPHRTASGEPHIGSLATVGAKEWGNPSYREEIANKISKEFALPGQGAGLGQTFYDLKSTFLEDAMTCWKGFGRTTNPAHCAYRSDSKRLLPDTSAERKDLGLSPKDRPNTFLCDFCPVHSLVLQKRREEAGMYKKQKWE